MKAFIKIILFLSLPFFVRSQQNLDDKQQQKNELDSLQAVLKNAPNDTLRMGVYVRFAYYYMGIQRDSGLYCAEQALLLAKKLKLRFWEAFSYDAGGYLLNELGNYSKSLQYLLKGIKIAENPETEKGMWNSTSFNTDARSARLSILSQLHHNMGYLYDQTGNLRQAISEYFEAIKIAEETKNEGKVSLNHLTLGGTYLKMNLPDSAIIYEKKRLSYIDPFPVNPMRGLCLLVLGKAYLLKGNKTLAKKYLNESIQVGLEEKSFKFLADANLSKANLFRDEGAIDSSLWFAKKKPGIISGNRFTGWNGRCIYLTVYNI